MSLDEELAMIKVRGFNRGWSRIGNWTGYWQPGMPPQRLSNHAVLRYMQRVLYGKRETYTIQERVVARDKLTAMILAGITFVGIEQGTSQSQWRCGDDGVLITTIADLVKTVHPIGTTKKIYRPRK